MIQVERRETPGAPGDVADLLKTLETAPGLWMGCDVVSEGLYQRRSMACADAALHFSLDGRQLTVTAISPAGGGLLVHLRSLADFEPQPGRLRATMASGTAVVALLRRFLAMFRPHSAELAYFGAFSFDLYRLSESAPLPDDGRRRMVLYFPERVLVAGEQSSKWVEFRWPGQDGPTASPARVAAPAADDDMPAGGHARRVARGVEKLRRGELFSLVLSQTFRRRTKVPASEAFAALRGRNPYPGMFFCNLGGGELLFGASPDLQARASGRTVDSAPVCGTLRRGADPMEDAAQALALLASSKEGAAIALCADSAAQELALVCEPGTVKVLSHRRPYFFSTIIHAISHVSGERRESVDAFDILLAHATPATVTGLPKAAAIGAIEEIEGDWRGWYAGAVARIGSDGSLEVYTVLRAARVVDGVAEIRTGGNIVQDSDPDKEEDESQLKALTLFRVLEGRAAAPRAVASAGFRVRLLESDDPFAARFASALAGAGGVADDLGGVAILSGRPRGEVNKGPLVAVADGALWLLAREGIELQSLTPPAIARPVRGKGLEGGFLSAEALALGLYASHTVRPEALRAGWSASAVSEEGWLLAAQHDETRRCVLLFRPDSVLSLQGESGPRALSRALSWSTHAKVKT